MFHRVGGLYRILEWANVYRAFQTLLGGPHSRKRFVEEFVMPFEGVALLDVGCGSGILLDSLPDSTKYVGFDMNQGYIDTACLRFGSRGSFFCARVGQEPEELRNNSFDLVVANSLLHHLGDDDAHRLLHTATRVLRAGGAFVSIDATFHEDQPWFARFLAHLDRGGAVRSPAAYLRLLESHFPHVDGWLRTDLLRVPYSHWVMRATKRSRELVQ